MNAMNQHSFTCICFWTWWSLPYSTFCFDFWAFEELPNRVWNDIHLPYSKDYFWKRSNRDNFIAAANLIFSNLIYFIRRLMHQHKSNMKTMCFSYGNAALFSKIWPDSLLLGSGLEIFLDFYLSNCFIYRFLENGKSCI